MHYMAVGSKTGQKKLCLSVPVRVTVQNHSVSELAGKGWWTCSEILLVIVS